MAVSPRSPAAELAAWITLGTRLEERVLPSISGALLAFWRTNARLYWLPEAAHRALRDRLAAVLRRHYRLTIRAFAARERADARGAKAWDVKDDLVADAVERQAAWIEATALVMSKVVADTERNALSKVIADGVRSGKSPDQIAVELRRNGLDTTPARARAIARTETYRAADVGQKVGVKTLGVTIRSKQWITAGDHRVRPDHRTVRRANDDEADRYIGDQSFDDDDTPPPSIPGVPRRGKAWTCPVHHAVALEIKKRRKPNLDPGPQDWPIAPIHGKFVCGGVVCDGPRDPILPAALVVNCRCVLSYREEEADAADGVFPDDFAPAAPSGL